MIRFHRSFYPGTLSGSHTLASSPKGGSFFAERWGSGIARKLPLRGSWQNRQVLTEGVQPVESLPQMPFPSTTPPVKMRLVRSAELVGAKPLHLLTQTALPLKSPTGAFIAALRSANAVAPNAKFKTFFPLNMCRAQRSTF